MTAPSCDIIIPAYNGHRVLPLALTALGQQQIPPSWNVGIIIIDDGSSPPLKLRPANNTLHITVLRQRHAGAAAARNRGIRQSSADILLFLGADILLRPGALAQHLNFHQQHPASSAGALGVVTWDPRLRPTPFMEWMVHGGPQNNFDDLLGRHTAPPRHFFYGSHISLKRSLLRGHKFPTVYNQYGWEDLDLGCQLESRGLKLTVLHQAIGLHRHFYTAADIYRRQAAAAKGLAIFYRRNRDKVQLPRVSPRARYKLALYKLPAVRFILQKLAASIGSRRSLPWLFEAITTAEFLRNSGKMYDRYISK